MENSNLSSNDLDAYSNQFEKYEFYETVRVGRGAHADVILAKHLETNEMRAAKIMQFIYLNKNKEENERNFKKIMREAELISQMNHPNVLKFYECFQRLNHFYIISEYCEEELSTVLQNYVHNNLHPTKNLIIEWYFKLSRGLKYLHDKKIIHRDLKPSNILFKNKEIKIADFGESKQIILLLTTMNTVCGTPRYMSPEMFRGEAITYKTDIWSLGCVFYEIYYLEVAFHGRDINEVKNNVLNRRFTCAHNEKNGLSSIIDRMLCVDETKRASIENILKDQLFNILKQKVLSFDNLIKNEEFKFEWKLKRNLNKLSLSDDCLNLKPSKESNIVMKTQFKIFNELNEKYEQSRIKPIHEVKCVEPKPSSRRVKKDDEDLSPPIVVSNKNKRMQEEKALKTLKWNFDVPRREFVDKLKMQFEPCVNRTLLTQLFHNDFKHHINALTTLLKCIEDSPDAIISNCDLILRWLTLRFFETNPTVIVKAIEFMQALFNLLSSKQHTLIDFEATAFIPYFITKLGDPKDPIRKGFRQIVKQISQVYPPVKVFNFLIVGLESKNARQRAECLEEMGQMIEAVGLNPFNPTVNLKKIAKQIGDRSVNVRNAALNTITIAHQIAGDDVFKCIGQLNDKDQHMLEERIKRNVKETGFTNKNEMMQKSVNDPAVPLLRSPSMLNKSRANPTPFLNKDEQHKQFTEPRRKIVKSKSLMNSRESSKNSLKRSRISPSPKPRIQQALSIESAIGNNINVRKESSSSITKLTQMLHESKVIIHNSISIENKSNIYNKELKKKHTRSQTEKSAEKDTINIDLNKKADTSQVDSPPENLNSSYYLYPIETLQYQCSQSMESSKIEYAIIDIAAGKIDDSFENLLKINYLIESCKEKDLLECHIDNLLNRCAVKLSVVNKLYLNNIDYKENECYKLLEALFTVIVNVFKNNFGPFCNIDTMKNLLFNLFSFMVDTKRNSLPNHDKLIQALNIVIINVLKYSEQTNCFCALVKLLTNICNKENLNDIFLLLVMKCIWRQIRRLSTADSLISQINTSKVLAEIHTFFKLFPTHSWQTNEPNLPLRTINALLYHLAKTRDKKIMEDLKLIERPEESEIKSCIMELFDKGFQSTSAIMDHQLI